MKHGLLFFFVVAGLILGGCHASDETSKDQTETTPPPQPSATETMQKDLVTLRTANDSLLQQMTKLEQDNRSAAAHTAELETQIGQLKEQLAAVPPPPPKPAMANVTEGYAHALRLFHAKNYEESAALFQEVLDAALPQRCKIIAITGWVSVPTDKNISRKRSDIFKRCSNLRFPRRKTTRR